MGFNWSGSGGSSAATNLNLVLDCSSSTGITYTASEIEFTEGAAKLKNQFADDVVFAATYATSINATYSKMGGSLTGTATAGSTRIVAVLHSADGSTTPALASAILVYS